MYLKLIPTIEFRIFKELKIGVGIFGGIKIKDFLQKLPAINMSSRNYYGGMSSLSYGHKKVIFRVVYYHSKNVLHLYKLKVKKKNRVFQLGIGYILFGTDPKAQKRK